jgi:hypothetical protein
MSTIEYLARCHCGALTARYRTAIAPADWSVRACQCSFFRSHGALATSDPEGSLEFRSTDTTQVHRYRFGGRTAEFSVCRECGVYVGVQMVSEEGRFGVLNVLSLRPLLALPTAEPMDYGAVYPPKRSTRPSSVTLSDLTGRQTSSALWIEREGDDDFTGSLLELRYHCLLRLQRDLLER